MRPKLYTARNFALLAAAILILSGMAYWLKSGMPLPGASVPSTAGKIAFVSNRDGKNSLWMMNADGSDAVSLASDVGSDDAPAWSADGSMLAYVTSGDAAKGQNPQIAEMNAAVGSHVATLTQTSSSKSAPQFGPENRVFYLAAGELVATTTDGTDSDKIFPTADEQAPLQGNGDFPGILGMGGVSRAVVSPDGSRLALSIKTEHGESLLLYETKTQTCAFLGVGERIFFDFLPDGRLATVFRAGSPLKQPQIIFNADYLHAPASSHAVPMQAIDSTPPEPENSIAFFDMSGNPQTPFPPLAFAPQAFAVSPDGQWAALGASAGEKKGQAGVFILPLGSGSQVPPLYNGDAQDLSFSRDGKNVAFVSHGDIYTAPADGGAPARNLTNGKGQNKAPVWSPAAAH